MKTPKVLGKEYGITITRPWNDEMYEHNDAIAEVMKKNITKALKGKHTAESLNDMARSITGYTFAMMDAKEIRQELLEAVDRLQNYWLAQEYPTLVNKGYCKPTEMNMIGY